jgi:hypothetical protein
MQSTSDGQTATSPAPPAGPRLRMQPDGPGSTLLDGGWWPRSGDPAAELAGLIPALDERHGRVTRLLLGTADWTGARPRRISVGAPAARRVVKLGWFDSMPGGLLTAISVGGQRTDLVTIPPGSSERAASAAMDQATKAGNRERSPAILAAVAAAADARPAADEPGAGE